VIVHISCHSTEKCLIQGRIILQSIFFLEEEEEEEKKINHLLFVCTEIVWV
jgi:hypothetical protein